MIFPNPLRFLASILRDLGWWVRGYRLLAPDYLVEARREACEACPFNDGDQCGQCGCILEAKIRLACEECPLKVWGPVKIPRRN